VHASKFLSVLFIRTHTHEKSKADEFDNISDSKLKSL
jgi:hypothetical protein